MTNEERRNTQEAKEAAEEAKHLDELVDEQSEDSFPASDAPSRSPVSGTGTPPKESRDDEPSQA